MKRLGVVMAWWLGVAVPMLLLAEDKPAAKSAEKELKQTTCPLSGKPIDKSASVKHDGQEVYFCCMNCAGKFEKEPMKYLPAVYRQIYPQTIQVTCPVMGGPADPAVFVEHKGQRVNLCCKDCNEDFAKDPEKYIAKLPAVSTHQVHCPISGRAINPKASFEEEKGKAVYFCCENCLGKYKADPAKFADAVKPTAGLVAFGATAKDDLIICPTCVPKGGIHKRSEVKPVVYQGMLFGTCGDACAKALRENPAKYLKDLQAAMIKQLGEGKWYTCAMHPAVLEKAEGKCPVCSMKLTPVGATN